MKASNILDEIVAYTRQKVKADQRSRPLSDLVRMQADAPPARPFADALRGEFGVIAEIKKESPSKGAMLAANVADAPAAYEDHTLVKAVSVLTNGPHFGMSIEELGRLRGLITKPILRKDFIVNAYQVHEARAFGADAVLLMANVLKRDELHELWSLCKDLGMDALFESHTPADIQSLPSDVRVCGVNSRKLDSAKTFGVSLRYVLSRQGLWNDAEYKKFNLISQLPRQAVRVAESGVGEKNIADVREQGWNATLIGTSLLMHPKGVKVALSVLQNALSEKNYPQIAPSGQPHLA